MDKVGPTMDSISKDVQHYLILNRETRLEINAPTFLIENPKCIFIHIPKTGGTSIRKGVFNLGDRNMCDKWGDVPAAWEKCFKFTFVRNPYDRLVSGWKYFGGEKNFSFANFVQIATDHKAHRGKPTGVPPHPGRVNSGREWEQFVRGSIYHHTMPQLHPYNNLKYADFVGRFENLQEDFDKICGRLNIPKQELPHLNKTNHKHYSSYYDKSTKMIADQYFKEDLQKLGYYFSKEWL